MAPSVFFEPARGHQEAKESVANLKTKRVWATVQFLKFATDFAVLVQPPCKKSLLVAVPPSIRPDPPDGNYVVKKGRKVELRCVASGNPDPTITWTRVVSSEDQAFSAHHF